MSYGLQTGVCLKQGVALSKICLVPPQNDGQREKIGACNVSCVSVTVQCKALHRHCSREIEKMCNDVTVRKFLPDYTESI